MSIEIIIIALSLLLGFLAGWIVSRNRYDKKGENSLEDVSTIIELNREIAAKDQKIEDLNISIAKQEEKLKMEFENLAGKILDENSKKFTEQNRNTLKDILDPLGVKMAEFKEKVQETYVKGTRERSALTEQIKGLTELNKKMSQDATNLTNALKGDSKVQGDWGEFKLEMILEKAGLVSGIHYTTQPTYKDEDGALKRPDFIINLPEEKNLIIDSKVSLTAYEAFCSCEKEEEKERYLKEHLKSVKGHIKELNAKNYQKLYQINTPDYVLMYIPIEPAFIMAIQDDPELMGWAVEKKNIVLVATSTLLATLSMVSSIWKQEDQKRNVIEIARQSGALYDKFVGFSEDLIDVGKRMDSAKNSYEGAMKKLVDGKDNLVRKTEKIKKLGAKTQKSIPDSLLDRAEAIDDYENDRSDVGANDLDE